MGELEGKEGEGDVDEREGGDEGTESSVSSCGKKRVFTPNLANLSRLARNMGVLIQEPCHIGSPTKTITLFPKQPNI